MRQQWDSRRVRQMTGFFRTQQQQQFDAPDPPFKRCPNPLLCLNQAAIRYH